MNIITLRNAIIRIAAVPPLITCNPFTFMLYDAPGSEKNPLVHILVGTSLSGPLFWVASGYTKTIVPLSIYCGLWYGSCFLIEMRGGTNK